MFKGRKVSNPVVHGAAVNRYSSDKDLAHVWNSIGKARTELRKTEHRLGDVETRPIPRLNETGETSITEYSPAMENDQTFTLPPEFPSGAVVDKFGRSAYMRNKTHSASGTGRKISRLDDKYTEEQDGGGRSMGSQRDVLDYRGDRRPAENAGKDQVMNSNRNKDRHGRGSDRASVSSPKRVDFHDRLNLREINNDGTYTDLAVGGVSSLPVGQGHYRPNSPGSTINTTDSLALRETEIRFLNDTRHTVAQRADSDVRWTASNVLLSSGNKLTHVNVTVPGGVRQGSSGKIAGSTHYMKSASNQNPGSREGDGASSDMDRRWEVGSSDSGQSDDRLLNRRFKASIKDIDKDGLAKLKEKIRKQQEKSSPGPPESHDHMDVMGASEGAASLDNAPRHALHTDFEPVEPRSFDLPPPDGATSKQPKVRKVAAGPPAPSYKGFSETEVKFKHMEAKPTKTHDIRKKDKRKKQPLKLQDKKHDPPDDRREEPGKSDKPKRVTRVVAGSNQKHAKPDKKADIITTSSWRAGQELVLRELGPVKVRRTSQTSDTQGDRVSNPPDGASYDREGLAVMDSVPQPNNEHASATAVELEKARALSLEARRVLSDLNFTGSDDEDWKKQKEEPRHREHKPTLKRKAPKMSAEAEKQASSAKHRHYDAEEIRRYMQKQKASRLKQQREDERRQKEADEIKRRQLEELKSKQKQTASAAASASTQNKKVKDTTFSKARHRTEDSGAYHTTTNYADLPRHHPFHEDRQRMLVSSESEKENFEHGVIGPPPGHRELEDMDMSDDSSTITGDSMEEATPSAMPSVVDSELKDKAKTKVRRADRDESRNFDSDSNVRNVGGFNFNVDSVLSKFSQALNSKGGDLNVPPSTNTGFRSVNSNAGQGHSALLEVNSDQPRSRADRVQAIKATADSLKNRLQAERRKITGQDVEGGATSNPIRNSRWALPQSNQSEDTFMSRYEKMIGADNDFSVFSSNLPGLRTLPADHPDDNENPMEAAAIRIQAAYRGHTVRQSLNWKLPSGQSVLASHRNEQDRDEDESSITETSTFSDITITEDSENSMASPPRKVGAGLRERDFHAGGSRWSRPSDDLHIPRPSGQSKDNKYSWEEPSDPYSVLNVYARHQRTQAKQRPGENSRPKNSSTPVKDESIRSEHRPPQQTTPKPAPRPDTRSRSPGVGRHSDSPVVDGFRSTGFASITETLHNERSRSEITQPKGLSVSFQPDRDDSDEDTLEEETYSHSKESEDEKKPKPYTREKRPVKPYPAASKPTTVLSSKHSSGKSSNKSDSDVSLDSAKDHSMSLSQAESEGATAPKEPARYSPSTLERQFYAELNQLESMEESMRQLTSMEKTREVSMAQQETVSLAQMLKARQQAHEREMMALELKAQQEAIDATQQLEGARKRAANASQTASESMARLRKQPTDEETPLKSIISQNEGRSLLESDNIRPRKSVKVSYSLSETGDRKVISESTRRSDPSYSRSSSRSSHITSDVRTAQDTQDSDSSIRSVSGAEGRDESKSESIQEDISQISGDEYSVIFDETMTEDEVEERSFKAILPSESHRKRAKKHMSDSMSVTSDEGSVSAPATPRMSLDDLSSFFTGEESFNKFTEEMVKQFMKEEEMRSHHQNSLLHLREKALMEKTKAELAWLEQQKHRIRNKGADDSYPQIIKKQRGLKMRLQEQQAEIKRLQEANKAASRERQLILQQREEINRMRQSTQQTKDKIKGRGRLGRPSEVHTEDEVSGLDEHRDTNDRKQKKDYKSDSEIYTEPKAASRASKQEAKSLEKLKKIHLDYKFLTVREQKLLDRRKNAEELLRWKKRLDEEEAKIFQLEQKALKVWEQKGQPDNANKKRTDKDTAVKQVADSREKAIPKSRKDVKECQTASTVQESSAISENIITAKDDSVRKSISNTPRTDIASGGESSPEELRQRDNVKEPRGLEQGLSGSESSIPEEVASVASSVEEASPSARKMRTSTADDTIINDSLYGNESFEETTSRQATSKKSGKSPRSPLERLSRKGLQWLAGRDIRSPKSFNKGRSSESESEESISHTDVSYTETQSDFSDYEGRVRALNEELKRRKIEADRLKKERKKRKKEILKNKEEALKKQIEAYDNQIVQLKAELQKEMEHEPVKAGSVKPQIKQPKVSPTKNKAKPEVTPPRSTNSSICEESKDGQDSSTQSSPSVIEDKDHRQISPATKPVPTPKSVSQSLEKISEDSESKTLSKSRSEGQRWSTLRQPGSRESSYRDDKTDGTEEIGEDISQAESISVRSDILPKNSPRIVTAATQDVAPESQADDYSYTEDFTADLPTADERHHISSHNILSEHSEARMQDRSGRTVTEPISEQISGALFEHSDSEQFVHPLDIHKTVETKQDEESDVEPKSPRSYSARTDSRPSSEKSERSLSSVEESLTDDVESEPTPSLPASLPPSVVNPTASDEEAEVISETVLKTEPVNNIGATEIDFKDDFEDEEITPIPSPPGEEVDPMADFNIRDRVLVSGPQGSKKAGTLQYKGKVSFAPGIWAGIELDTADGTNDGSHEGQRYFTCSPGHGVFVPGDTLVPEPAIRSPRRSMSQESFASSRSTDSHNEESVTDQEDSDLSKFISEADKNVQGFGESPYTSSQRQQALTSTEQILEKVIKDDKNAINKAVDRKTPPPVAPKPNRTEIVNGGNKVIANGIGEHDTQQDINQNDKHTNMTHKLTKNLLDAAIIDMITIRNKQRSRQAPQDLISFDEDDLLPTDQDKHLDIPPRPESPLPGGNVQNSEDLEKLKMDIDSLFEGDYIEDGVLPLVHQKPPPPYPGTQQELMPENSQMKFEQLQEELIFAVPHERSEIEQLVSNAVDVFWNQRRYGESLDGLEPPESYFTAEDNNNDMDGKSKRVFKKLLFDLTGDIIKEIYKDDEKGDNPPWQKMKRRQQKYFRGVTAPTTVDILKPVVQQAVIDMLGLNGSRKSDKTQWSVRKKKDHVDNILVQELREEEPDWVNYDDDEMAVKMQLTEAIFETLLTDTMQTMNKIFRKKQLFSQK